MRVGLVAPLSHNTDDAAASDRALAETTLRLADELFRAELSTADAIDLKAAGLLGAVVAALAIIVTFHDSLAHWWAVPASFLALSAFFFFLVLRARRWELGIDPEDFWRSHRHRSPQAMLEDALAITERNRLHNEPHLEAKALWFRCGYWALALGMPTLLGTLLER